MGTNSCLFSSVTLESLYWHIQSIHLATFPLFISPVMFFLPCSVYLPWSFIIIATLSTVLPLSPFLLYFAGKPHPKLNPVLFLFHSCTQALVFNWKKLAPVLTGLTLHVAHRLQVSPPYCPTILIQYPS